MDTIYGFINFYDTSHWPLCSLSSFIICVIRLKFCYSYFRNKLKISRLIIFLQIGDYDSENVKMFLSRTLEKRRSFKNLESIQAEDYFPNS